MKILLTGVTGYIAQRLLPVLLENGNEVVCCVRDSNRFNRKNYQTSNLSIIEVDFLNRSTLSNIPDDIKVAYYLIHSMSTQKGDFEDLEEDDERIYLMQELLDYLDIEVIKKEKFIELNFIKMEEEYNESLFSKDELKTIHKIVSQYQDTSSRNIANDCFKIDEVRNTPKGEIII